MSDKVKIFIDFWNLMLCWKEFHHTANPGQLINLPWDVKLPAVMLAKSGPDCRYVGTHVYASVDPNKESDKKLRNFLENTMNCYKGYHVIIKDRKPAKPIVCSHGPCHKVITTCPHCNQRLTRTTEKGIDTSIVTDLMQFAMDDVYDKAILVSGDSDFIPAIEYVQNRGKYIIHAGFKNEAYPIRKACWEHFFFDDVMDLLLAT